MNGTIQYTIRPYDTIWMLAQVFNTTVDSILDLNPGIEPRNLMIGQVITIRPGYQYYPSYSNAPAGSEFSTPNMRTMPGTGTTMPATPGMPTMPGTGATMPATPGMPTMPGRGTAGSTMPSRGMNDRTMPGSGMNDQNRMYYDRMNREMMDHDMQDLCGNMMDLIIQFRQLWMEHSVWTAFTILSLVQNLPEAEVYTQRLLRNPTDFAAALEPFYGEEAAQRFGQLLSEHLKIAAEIVKTALAGDNNAMTDADRRWHENANEIAMLLASLNSMWSEEDWMAMMYEHLDNVSAFAETLIAGDYQGSVNAYDQMLAQVLEMGDMMAEGIAMQFPD